ncbi:hypothetical protein H4S08_002545 [Coemansia sp. RSA 1365]|nr:hypothetical protein H4S08_002545 [Coemansia sp. RSA 1365]
MVSLIAYAASLLALASAARAGFYTTYPVGSDAINSGQSIQIQWRPNADAPDLSNVKKYTLKFMTGGDLVQTTVATIGTFDVSQTTVPFTVPKTAPGMYFLMYTAEGGSGSSWSTRFSVDGGTSWYPDGVATGKDPSETSDGDNGDSTSISQDPHPTPSDTKPTDDSNDTSTSQTEDHGSSSSDPIPSSTKGGNDGNDNPGNDNGNGDGNGNEGENSHHETSTEKTTSTSDDGESDVTNRHSSSDTDSDDSDSDDVDTRDNDETSGDDSDDKSPHTGNAACYILSSLPMANIQLPAGTTVNLENVPLHQFYHLSLHPATPVVIVAVYTLIVQVLNSTRSKTLSRIEAKRRDLKLGDVLNEGSGKIRRSQNGPWMTATVVLHNLALAAFSYWCATNYTTTFFQTVREEGIRCADTDNPIALYNLAIESSRKATFLQTYHHAGAIMTMWVGCYFGSPQLIFYVVENSIIHTLMYTYFALTAMGYSPPGKKYLTHLQIFQFLIGLVFIALYITIPGCLTPLQRNLLFVMLSYLIPLIYLFVDFSIKTYGKKNKAKTL